MILTAQLKKYIKSLHHHKYRQKYNKFIAEGPKVCGEFLTESKYTFDWILASAEWIESHPDLIQKLGEKLIAVDDKGLNSLSAMQNSNKILIVGNQIKPSSSKSSLKLTSQWGIYTDRIQDPGNMGTILRIADWYGVSQVIVSPDSVDAYNPKVIQSAMGAHNRMEILKADIQDIELNNKALIALALDGTNINQLKIDSGLIIVGNESKGVNPQLMARVDHKASISRLGGAESLNASVACGIACQVLINS